MASEDEKQTSSNSGASSISQDDERDQEKSDGIALPVHVAGSGTLDRLVDTARDYARQATSENTNKAYKKDWAHFSSWCRRRGADPLPPSPELVGLYIANCATPDTKSPVREHDRAPPVWSHLAVPAAGFYPRSQKPAYRHAAGRD